MKNVNSVTNRVRCWGPTETLSTPASLQRLWEPIGKRRGETKTVTVSVDDLVALLNDHARFCDVCNATS